ncbi:prostatic acid phosphatase-like [Ostrinia furnacalis]|uniref:prostatic acid phosphatase-like n=1 Tax=Ostrinia furnacalis TaxID=93504 RepID=UPI001040C13B|nr:prostatic acid phosphatase-like [Ostrinia furnacalis]
MLKLACVLLLATNALAVDLKGTEIVMTFLVHRHGDRTPVEPTLSFSTNPIKLAELTMPYGYGQLTKAGKTRAYKLGQFIRNRYRFISPQYNRSEVYIRSTDSTRAKMTVLSVLAAMYPATEKLFDEDIKWTPVPYTTVPMKYDFNLATLNCPVFSNNYINLLPASSDYMSTHGPAVDLLAKQTSRHVSQLTPTLAFAIVDVYNSQLSLGMPLNNEIDAAWPELQAAAGAAIDIVFGDENYIALEAGVLLNEFYKAASGVISGTESRRFWIYSGHDLNVYGLTAVTKVTERQGVPKYASAYALELRKVVETGKYVVVPVYLPSPGEELKYLEIEGCGTVCDYQQFVNITSKYALDETTWRARCGFSDDLVFDEDHLA